MIAKQLTLLGTTAHPLGLRPCLLQVNLSHRDLIRRMWTTMSGKISNSRDGLLAWPLSQGIRYNICRAGTTDGQTHHLRLGGKTKGSISIGLLIWPEETETKIRFTVSRTPTKTLMERGGIRFAISSFLTYSASLFQCPGQALLN